MVGCEVWRRATTKETRKGIINDEGVWGGGERKPARISRYANAKTHTPRGKAKEGG